MTMPKKILIATDLEAATQKAIDAGFELARTLHADVCLATVLTVQGTSNLSALPPSVLEDARAFANRQLHSATEQDPLPNGKLETRLLYGSPATALLQEAKELGADLIVIGSHHHRGLGHLLGSVAAQVVRQAACSVMVVQL